MCALWMIVMSVIIKIIIKIIIIIAYLFHFYHVKLHATRSQSFPTIYLLIIFFSNKPASLCKITYTTCFTPPLRYCFKVNQEYILLAHVDRFLLYIIYCAVIVN